MTELLELLYLCGATIFFRFGAEYNVLDVESIFFRVNANIITTTCCDPNACKCLKNRVSCPSPACACSQINFGVCQVQIGKESKTTFSNLTLDCHNIVMIYD